MIDGIPLIGPHEGRELELMLAGTKPIAMFHEVVGHDDGLELIPEVAFSPYVDAGRFLCHQESIQSSGHTLRYVFYAQTNRAHNLKRLIEIVRHKHDPNRNRNIPWPVEFESEIGRLLGYSQEAIDYFIQNKT